MYANSNGYRVSIPSARSRKRKHADEFDQLDEQPWYTNYKEISVNLDSILEELNKSLYENLKCDIVRFIDTHEFSPELVPAITILPGSNLPDHELIFSVITRGIREECRTKSIMVYLNPAKANKLKYLIENTIYDLMNQFPQEEDDSEDLDDSDAVNVKPIKRLKKSECTLFRLVDWYTNNIKGEDNDSKSTYLIIVIPDIGAFPEHRLPFVFVMGIPSTLNIIRKTLSNDVLSKLSVHLFQSPPSVSFIDKVLEEVFLSPDCTFQLGGRTFQKLCSLFLEYHFSVKEFIKGIKLCAMEHFYNFNFDIVCCTSEEISEKFDALSSDDITSLLALPSMEKYNQKRKSEEQKEWTASTANIRTKLKKLRMEFGRNLIGFHLTIRSIHALLKCITENSLRASIREVYIQVMNPDERSEWLKKKLDYLNHLSKDALLEVLKNVLDLLCDFVEDSNISAIHSKLQKHIVIIENSELHPTKKTPTKSPVELSKASNRRDFRQNLRNNACKDKLLSEFEQTKNNVLEFLQNDFFKIYLKSVDSVPLRELFFFDDDEVISRLLDGEPQSAIKLALQTPSHYLECDCCELKSPGDIVKSMPDLSIVYKLHLESGNQINLYDWFQQFRVKVDEEDFSDDAVSSEIYARFVHAVREMHFLGFITSPKKKASNSADFVTKLTVYE